MPEEQTEQQKGITYKINTSHHYSIKTMEYGDKIFYSVSLAKTNYDKTKMFYNRQLRFVKCEPPEAGDVIRIISGFEDAYFGKLDKYNAIPVYCITEYEVVTPSAEAFTEYNNTMAENEAIISDEDLPF